MRTTSISLILALAACSSGSSSPSVDSSTGETIRLTCSSSIAEYCATAHCDLELAVAKQDRSLCPASLIRCNDYDVILRSSVDTSTNYYYQGGQLVAIEFIRYPGQYSCTAGPAMFDAQHCATTDQPLPACASGAQ
jgi:hypothetical protein